MQKYCLKQSLFMMSEMQKILRSNLLAMGKNRRRGYFATSNPQLIGEFQMNF